MGRLSGLRARVLAGMTAPAGLGGRLDAVGALLGPLEAVYAREVPQWPTPKYAETPFGRALAGADDPQLRAAALWAQRRMCSRSSVWDVWPAVQLAGALGRKKLAWTAAEVAWALRLVAAHGPGGDWELLERARLPISAAERLPRAEVAELTEQLEDLRLRAGRAAQLLPASERQRLTQRLDALLSDAGQRSCELPPSILHAGDAFGPATRARFGHRLQADGIAALLVHAASASSPNPSAKWLADGRRLLVAAAGGSEIVRDVLGAALTHRESLQRVPYSDGDHWVWLHESSALLLRGLALLAGQLDEPWVTPLLGDLAVHAGTGLGGSVSSPRDVMVTNAAVAALTGRRDAVPHLARAQARIKHRGVLKGVTRALETAAQRAGTGRSELLETAVPTHGLDGTGERREPLGEHTAVLGVVVPGVVSLAFDNRAGTRLSSVPAAVKNGSPDRLAELRAEVREIRKTLTTERLRVEGLLAEGRSWTSARWARHYRDHPIVGRIVRSLLWQVGDGDTWRTGRLLDDGTLTDLDGAPVGEAERVRLWHPALAPVDEVRGWREALLDASVRQPFKQAFREVYLLTPAEVETRDHSNRFAAHVLRAPQAQALMRTRGWGGNHLGYYDGGFEGHVAREFGDDWRAEFSFDLVVDDADDGMASLASSDQVRFSRREGRGWSSRPLAEVPPLVFSEAMRDVDLFVGATSIAADPAWITRGARAHETYWQRVGFGELGESARTRREALERLVPRLRIADRCMVTDRFLEVRGSLRTYKIHLGSGNVLMTPNDEYLCIVPGRGGAGPQVFLPFEENGGMLSIILSKAFLLADDASISDRSITMQIRRR